ncbi:MAG: glycosyltransferase, partial [Candidatus Eisenbacteria bacterium]
MSPRGLRIAHLDTGRSWRGGQQQVLLLLEGLRDRGIECLLLAPRGPLLERAEAARVPVETWNARGELDLAAIWSARRLLRRFGPDLVHLHSAHAHALGVPAARGAGRAPIVVSRRVDFAVGANTFSRLKYRMPVARYFCISRGVMEVMRQGGVPAERLALVPSGVRFATAAETERAPSLREEFGIGRDEPIVGTVAALAPHKNHADLMRAVPDVLARRPDAHFVWMGEGECRTSLEAQRRALGLEHRVHLAGFRECARDYVPQFRVFVMPSYLEGLCTSIMDAQSLGVPVVATETGGIPDLVTSGETGWLVPPRDPGSLAHGLLAALADPAEAGRRAAAARVAVQAFSADRMVERNL